MTIAPTSAPAASDPLLVVNGIEVIYNHVILVLKGVSLQVPRESIVVPLPKGGPGGDAFAPDIAGTSDGRWVIVWTEGKSGAYAVRAQTFGADLKPLGDPIAISPPAGNFGQAVVGFAGGYVTTMFLSRGASGSYELWGAVLQCGS